MRTIFLLIGSIIINFGCSEVEIDHSCTIACYEENVIGLDQNNQKTITLNDVVEDASIACSVNDFKLEIKDHDGLLVLNNIVNSTHVNASLDATVIQNNGKSACLTKLIIRDFDLEELVLEDSKITCINCHEFAKIIEYYNNQIFIADRNTVWIINNTGIDKDLVQKIEVPGYHSIWSIKVNFGILAIGSTSGDDPGVVFIYKKSGDNWIFDQKINGYANGSNFGCNIDISENRMVVGASAIWNDGEPRVYVFKRAIDEYILEAELIAGDPSSNHRFGEAVAIFGNHVLASSVFNDLHIFQFIDDEWALSKMYDYRPFVMDHDADQFMMGFEFGMSGFTLDEDGNIFIQDVNPGFDEQSISGHGEIITIEENLALLDVQEDDVCYLVEFDGVKWKFSREYIPPAEESCVYYGLEINDDYIIIGEKIKAIHILWDMFISMLDSEHSYESRL